MEPPIIIPSEANIVSSTPTLLGNLDVFSDEVVLKFLLEIESLDDLANWCQTSKRASEICRYDGFWHQKYTKNMALLS
jgi:hypothetical protein